MTGPEHYHEAERLVASTSLRNPLPEDANKLAAAQVHATLALAAATIDTADLCPSVAWVEVTRGAA
ncbi:hypothetical protein [Amycolatopsis sp. NPDC050768]|uniref:hypothetical protein n=1 Tax=Amycolatopsis sp. NPDC050768 TaxID=3154839 RepID=UPI0033FBA485